MEEEKAWYCAICTFLFNWYLFFICFLDSFPTPPSALFFCFSPAQVQINARKHRSCFLSVEICGRDQSLRDISSRLDFVTEIDYILVQIYVLLTLALLVSDKLVLKFLNLAEWGQKGGYLCQTCNFAALFDWNSSQGVILQIALPGVG